METLVRGYTTLYVDSVNCILVSDISNPFLWLPGHTLIHGLFTTPADTYVPNMQGFRFRKLGTTTRYTTSEALLDDYTLLLMDGSRWDAVSGLIQSMNTARQGG